MSVAIHEFRCSLIMAVAHGTDSWKHILEERIRFLLSVLPPGTRVVRVVELGIVDLSRSWHIELFHPLFAGVEGGTPATTRIELQFVRVAWKKSVLENEGIGQTNLFTEVMYFNKDGGRNFVLDA